MADALSASGLAANHMRLSDAVPRISGAPPRVQTLTSIPRRAAERGATGRGGHAHLRTTSGLPCTLHPMPYTLHSTPYTPHPTP